ncbi:MAG TPA: glycerophosphodiester phosphodiesterase [Anaerolineales bacterium]|nr:glycerophosphodiester phosphodiesterase [Anaerolineales bacterium]
MRLILSGAALYLFTALALRLLAQPAPNTSWFTLVSSRPLVIAHADDAGTSPWPGDTLLFLENAAALGVDVLEMNVHLSADGHIILIHDDTVDDTTDGTGPVAEKTLAELKALDAAYDWTQDGGQTFPYRGTGITIPTLEEVFQRLPDWPMIVEIKGASPGLPETLCSLVRQSGMENRVIIPSSNDASIADFRTRCPEIATAAATEEVRQFVILNFLFLANPFTPPYHAHQVPIESGGIPVITQSFVNAAHRRNLEIHAWTINDPDKMQRLIEMGVDGIMTDRPEVLLDLLGR